MTACAICLAIIDKSATVLECSHQFHKSCINKWLCDTDGLSCPCCRQVPSLVEGIYEARKRIVDCGLGTTLTTLLLQCYKTGERGIEPCEKLKRYQKVIRVATNEGFRKNVPELINSILNNLDAMKQKRPEEVQIIVENMMSNQK